MKKLFTFLAVALMSVSVIASPDAEKAERVDFFVKFPAENAPDAVEIIGTFDGGAGTALTLNPSTDYFEATFEAKPSDCFKFRSAGSWEQELEIYNMGSWVKIGDQQLVFGELWEDAAEGKSLGLDFSDPEEYRWTEKPVLIESGYCGDNLTWELRSDGVLSISGIGAMTDWPFSLDVPWNSYRSSITEVSIGNSVTSIGNNAFYHCDGLTSIEIPNSVTSIGNNAFYHCDGLTSIEIPNSVTSIGSSAFYGCSGLTSVTIGNSVTSMGEDAFGYCYDLISVTILNGVTSIGNLAFSACYSLASINIPNSVTSIGYGAFSECESLTSIEIPNSVTSIGIEAFYGCKSLTSPVYNAHIFAYLPTSYSGAYTVPDGIESIAGGAFMRCTGLTSIEIPNSVTSIGYGAFYGCTGLTSPVYTAHSFVFMPTAYSGAYTIPDGIEYIGGVAFGDCRDLTSIEIPNSVTSIGEGAFVNCLGLKSVTIPSNVASIGNGAFAQCDNLTSIINLADKPQICPESDFGNTDPFGYYIYYRCTLYVPAGSINLYKEAKYWEDFETILPNSAKNTETKDIQTTPTDNSVDVTWPAVDGAYTYELVIKDKEGNIVCTLIFNAQGQLTSIAFNAPAHNDAPQKTQTAGFVFTVTGLETGTEYDLTITAKNENGLEIDKKNISFHTSWPQGIEDIYINSDKSVKVLHDGHIYILRGDHIYDTQGKMIK